MCSKHGKTFPPSILIRTDSSRARRPVLVRLGAPSRNAMTYSGATASLLAVFSGNRALGPAMSLSRDLTPGQNDFARCLGRYLFRLLYPCNFDIRCSSPGPLYQRSWYPRRSGRFPGKIFRSATASYPLCRWRPPSLPQQAPLYLPCSGFGQVVHEIDAPRKLELR